MAYNTKPIVTDKDGNPISQYYNPSTDEYEPVEGAGGGNKVVLYKEDGTPNEELSLQPILDKLTQLTGTVIDEQTRQNNEVIRQDNEQNRIQLYNDLLAELERIEQIEQQVPETVIDSINTIKDRIGELANLETTDKTNIVSAINEVNTKIEEIEIVDMDAENVTYDNTVSELVATNVQRAIDEVDTNLKTHQADIVQTTAVNSSTKYPSSAVTYGLQQAINNHLNDYIKHLKSASIATDFNDYTENGVYSFTQTSQIANSPGFDYGGVVIFKNALGYIIQIAYRASITNPELKIRVATTTASWSEWKTITLS